MASKFIRIKVNGIVKSDQTTKRSINFSHHKTYGEAISTADITLRRQFGDTGTTEDETDFVSGCAVQVWMADTLVASQVDETSGNIVFSGYIDDREIDHFTITLRCGDRLILAKWAETTTGTANTPGEKQWNGTSTKTIFTELLAMIVGTNRPALAGTINGSTPSPATLTKYVVENNSIYEKLWEIANIINWQFYYDPATDKVIFEPRGTPTAQTFYNMPAGAGIAQDGKSYNWTGKTVNIAGEVKWVSDSKDLVNDIGGVGGQTEILKVETHTVVGGTKNYYFDDSVGGTIRLVPFTVVVVGVQSGKTYVQNTDYAVTSTSIWFYIPATIPDGTDTSFTITYKYKLTAANRQTTSDGTSQAAHIKRTRTFNKRNIVNSGDVSSYLTTLLGGSKDPITETTFEVRPSTVPIIGSLVNIYDGIIHRVELSNLTPTPIITSITSHWPLPTDTVTISTKPLKYENSDQTTYDRIDKLDKEQTKTNADSFLKMDDGTGTGSASLITGHLVFGKTSTGTAVQLKKPVIDNLSSAPSVASSVEGQLYQDTTTHFPYYFNGTAWASFGTAGAVTGTGADNTVAVWNGTTALDTGHAANDLSFDSYSGIKFYYGVGSTYAGEIRSFNGVTNSSLLINSPNGCLQLSGNNGIKFNSVVVTDIAMSGYKVGGLGAASTNGDAVRYEQVIGVYLPLAGGALTGDITTHHVNPVATSTYTLGGASNVWSNVYAHVHNVGDANTYINQTTGDMKFTVASGKTFKFVVS
jgi:hypothetical protein